MSNNKNISVIYKYCLKLYPNLNEDSHIREVVYPRSLFYKLARQYTRLSLSAIGRYPKLIRDHSSVLHSINNIFPVAFDNNFDIQENYAFFVKNTKIIALKENNYTLNTTKADYILKINNLQSQIIELNLIISENKIMRKYLPETASTKLTSNELRYRNLTEQNKNLYDLRVSAILRMMEYKRKKEDYEKIVCQE